MAASHNSFWNAYKKLCPAPSIRKSWFQILVTLAITSSFFIAIAVLENEQKGDNFSTNNQIPNSTKTDKLNTNNFPKNKLTKTDNTSIETQNNKCEYKFSIHTFICLISDLKLLAQAQNFAVISAAILFFWDTFDRKKQLERQAWQLIDGAQGSETSGARKQAIEELYQEGSDITGLDADGADLRGINLSGADLTRASFKNAILEEANLAGAILREANLAGANLQGADLRGTILLDANLTGADLKRLNRIDNNDNEIQITTKLQGAKLRRANLKNTVFYYTEFGEYNGENTDLSHTQFRKANISFIDFKNTNIEGAFLGGAKTGEDELKIEIIRQADNYKEAYYSQSFLNKYSKEIGSLKLDRNYEEKLQEELQKIRKLQLLKDKDNISSLNLIDLLSLLECILVESTENASQNSDTINVIISLKNKLADLNVLVDSAQQEILLAEEIDSDLDNQEKKDIEKLNSLKSDGEEMDRYIEQMQKDEE